MSETAIGLGRPSVLERPVQFGVAMGILLGVVERFLLHFELTTLGVAFLIVGLVLAWFGERSWIEVGRALATVGAVSIIVLRVLVLG